MPRRSVVAFGDSTTALREGITVYADLLQDMWHKRGVDVQVINAGVRGDHSEMARARFERDVLAHNPDVVILRFAINDSAIDVWATPPASVPRVSLARYCENLVWMMTEIRNVGAVPVLCTPNPLAWSAITLELYGRSPYLPEDADGFNVTLRDYVTATYELATSYAIALVDLDAAFRQHQSELRPSWQALLLDGMHPNDAGHRLAANLLIPTLDKILESFS
jgi:lysophospholipase L1-like esterase